MSGEQDLKKLLASIEPQLLEADYVFCSFPNSKYGDHAELQPIASCLEEEGLSLVIPKQQADENDIVYESVFRGISLKVHSSLDAVGLTAAISASLTQRNISANVIAGYFHDHIFVQREFAESAMDALSELSG
ncbi:MAG: ACT domain-containing protein [Pseudomonadota bacterium]